MQLEILRKADQRGIEATLRKYNLAWNLYYNWKNKFDCLGLDGLQTKYHKSDPKVATGGSIAHSHKKNHLK